jgi:hypothetical protein
MDCGGVLDIRSSIRYLDHFYSYPLMPSITMSGVLQEQAYIRKQAANCAAECIPQCGAEFFMDFAFMRSSTEDYKRPNKNTDRVVTSYDGHSSHLIIVDGASRRVWAFLLSVPWIPWWHGKQRKEKSEYLAYSIYVSTVTPPHNSLCIDKETCEL